MRRAAQLGYVVGNGLKIPIRVGLIEPPNELLRFSTDEVRIHVPALREVQAARDVLPVARGTAPLGTIYAWVETPLRMLRRRIRNERSSEVCVYPDLSAVERYGSLHARNRFIEAGLRRMRLRGLGTEPESVREWASGDPFRSINWKATARSGKLMVAQYEVERSQNVMLMIDSGRLMSARIGDQRKLDYAITAALSVASIAALANDRVGFAAFAKDIIRAQAPRQQGRSLEHLVRELHDVEPRFEEADYDRAFEFVSSRLHKRSLIVFFTDVIDPAAQSATLTQLRTLCRRHLVICAFMNDAAVEDALQAQPQTVQQAYRQSVALELRDERKTAAAVLTRLGVRVIDVPAKELTTALIDRYLQIKQRGAI